MKAETSREIRLWIKQVIVPTIVALAVVDSTNPQLKYKIKDKVTDIFNRDKNSSISGTEG